MDEFEFYIDVADPNIAVEYKVGASYYTRIWLRDEEALDMVIKKLEDLKIYAKYRDR